MRATLWAAGMIAAAIGLTATAARAADLPDDYTVYERGESPYDDPRYSGIYAAPKIEKRHYGDEHGDDYGRKRQHYKKRRHSSKKRHHRRRHYAKHKRQCRPKRHHRRHCRHRSEIRHALRDQGWRDVHPIKADHDSGTAIVRARHKRTHDRYRLRVDRCSGRVLHADLIHRRNHETYAYRPRRHRRTY